MATTFQWTTPESIASALFTELNSLADAAFCTASAAIDNSTGLYQYMLLELELGSLDPTAGAFSDVWIEVSTDGSQYSDHGKPLQTSALLCTFQLDEASAAQRLAPRIVTIPPLLFKLAVRNKSGVAFATSANALNYRRFNEQGGLAMALTPAQIATLHTELLLPAYAANVALGATVALAAQLNLPNPATTVFSSSVSGSDVVSCLVAAEVTALTTANRELLAVVMTGVPLDTSKANIRTLLGAIFAAGTTTRANLIAVASRPGSRAEILFAPNIFVTSDDVAAALK